MKEIMNKNKINELFTRGVGEFIDPNGVFRKKLENDPEKVVIKFGVDPTRPDLHLGHAVVLRKLREFQDLGVKVVFLIGDYTAQIGDPTGKSKIRPEIEQQEVETNMKTYLEQVGKILKTDDKVFSWIRNSDWFTAINDIGAPVGQKLSWTLSSGKVVDDIDANSTVGKSLLFEKSRMQTKDLFVITLRSFLWTLKHITHSRLIKRDLFQDRLNNGEELFLHEMMYPVLQGIDSFALDHIYNSCDLEVGGTDQLFNMLVGRDVMEMNQKTPQAVLSFKLLEGTDGKEKMSKSLDNYIGITDEPNDMYGKVMSIPDSSIGNYFELCTFTPMDEVEDIQKKLEKGSVNPKDIKMKLAKQIVAIYHGEDKAQKAEESFVNTFQKREIPEEMTELDGRGKTLMDILIEAKILSSKGDFRRLIEEGAVTDLSTDKKLTDANFIPENGMQFKIGKKRFIKIK
ncbi:MAG: tyrosine--tRNA ligase [Patescibacteria group bacterium]